MSSQKTDREEVYIEPSSYEDQNTRGAFNSIFSLVNRKTNDQAESQAESVRPGMSLEEDDLFNKQESIPILVNRDISRSNPEIVREQTKLQRDVHKSREIHRQLQNKKHRWRPSELELTVLKLHFEKNKYPSKEDKETILKNLELNFKSTIDMSQLNRWFQHEREKEAKHGDIGLSKNTYKKFKQEDLDFLKLRFEENTYPKTEDMIEMAKTLEVNLSKIENWYKHNRRSLAKKGAFTLKTKKYFKKDEVNYLLKMFELYPRPTKEQILEMGQHLNCNELQIKNWYSNKRKKLKLVAKRQGVESQETKLHQTEASIFPQQIPQGSDLFNNFHMNTIPQVLPMGTVLPTTDPNGFIPTLASARNFGAIQAPQVQNPYANPMFPATTAAAPLMNNVYPANLNAPYGASAALPNGVVPVIIIPASSTGLPLGQNNMMGGQMPTQEMDLKNFAQPQQMMFGNNGGIKTMATSNPFNNTFQQPMMQPMFNQASAQAQNYNFFKQGNPNSNGMEIAGGNWFGQNQAMNQAMQQSTPIIIVNKPGMQSQPMSFNIQTQPTNYIQTNMNPGAFGSGNMNMMPTVFNSAGGNMTGFPSYEAPMQIQYLTSLYCPYSNNNIFSNYYPVSQPNPGAGVPTPEKAAFGAEGGMMNGIQMNPQQFMNGGMQAFNQGMQRPFDARIFAAKNERDNDANKM